MLDDIPAIYRSVFSGFSKCGICSGLLSPFMQWDRAPRIRSADGGGWSCRAIIAATSFWSWRGGNCVLRTLARILGCRVEVRRWVKRG